MPRLVATDVAPVPHRISRHAHVKARPETPPAPPAATGIDYARLIDTAHHAELAQGVNYAALTSTPLTGTGSGRDGGRDGELPGQLNLPDSGLDRELELEAPVEDHARPVHGEVTA